MSLAFPNSIRRYEPGRGCVSFWGSEASLEVMFQVELDVLRSLSPTVIDGSESSFLVAFDLNRSAILGAARAAFQRSAGAIIGCRPTISASNGRWSPIARRGLALVTGSFDLPHLATSLLRSHRQSQEGATS